MDETNDVSVEDKLAAAFEKLEKGPTPDALDEREEVADEPEETVEAAAEEPEETTEAPEEAEEVEYEGKAYKLPKELKDALLRQADYTRKTQDVAELRRTFEAQKETVELQSKFYEKHADKVSELHYLNRQLQQFAQISTEQWAKLAEDNPAQYLTLDRQQRTLQDAFNRIQTEARQLEDSFKQEMSQARMKAQAQCAEELKRTIPNFGPEVIRSLDETGRAYGFTGEELAVLADPRQIRVLHDAMQYRKLQQSKSLVEKKVQNAQPVKLAGARASQSTAANQALAEAKARALKSGKPSDVQSFLERRFAASKR